MMPTRGSGASGTATRASSTRACTRRTSATSATIGAMIAAERPRGREARRMARIWVANRAGWASASRMARTPRNGLASAGIDVRQRLVATDVGQANDDRGIARGAQDGCVGRRLLRLARRAPRARQRRTRCGTGRSPPHRPRTRPPPRPDRRCSRHSRRGARRLVASGRPAKAASASPSHRAPRPRAPGHAARRRPDRAPPAPASPSIAISSTARGRGRRCPATQTTAGIPRARARIAAWEVRDPPSSAMPARRARSSSTVIDGARSSATTIERRSSRGAAAPARWRAIRAATSRTSAARADSTASSSSSSMAAACSPAASTAAIGVAPSVARPRAVLKQLLVGGHQRLGVEDLGLSRTTLVAQPRREAARARLQPPRPHRPAIGAARRRWPAAGGSRARRWPRRAPRAARAARRSCAVELLAQARRRPGRPGWRRRRRHPVRSAARRIRWPRATPRPMTPITLLALASLVGVARQVRRPARRRRIRRPPARRWRRDAHGALTGYEPRSRLQPSGCTTSFWPILRSVPARRRRDVVGVGSGHQQPRRQRVGDGRHRRQVERATGWR